MKRFQVNVNGKWAGGSYATEAEANTAAKTIRKSADDDIKVVPRGAQTPSTTPSPKK